MAAMSRLVLAAALWSGAAVAQGPELIAVLRDPGGAPVASAHGVVRGRPGAHLPALGDLEPFLTPGRTTRGEEVLSGTSDQRGVIRFVGAGGAARPGAASGVVWTDDGLGALVVDLYAGRPQRIELQPMAELTTAAGGESFSVYARVHLPGGRTVLPVAQRGASVRLPAGDYELWAQGKGGWIWERRRLLSGQRTLLQFDGPERRLIAPAGTGYVYPAGRPDVRLIRGGDECTLRGTATAAPMLAVRDGVVFGPAVLPFTAANEPLRWPPTAEEAMPRVSVRVPAERDTRMQLYSLSRSAAGTWRVLGIGRQPRSPSASQRPEPWFVLPQPTDGDIWLLLVTEGQAPQARPWRAGAEQTPFAIERGVDLQVACRDENGNPLVDVAVDYVPDGMEPATTAAHSDAFGIVRLGPVLGPGRLRISDERFANQTVELATIPLEPLPVTIAVGELLHGVARWADGAPAAGVVVTLRDPSGALRPAERAALSGEDGTFAFAGLSETRALVLFATATRDQHTWSARLDRLRAGGGSVDLVLRDEDPQLLPR